VRSTPEAAQDVADGVGRGAGVLPLVHGMVRDVAAPATGDEDLCAELAGTIQGDDTPSSAGRR
jgi:hypothetical protein